MWWPVSQSLLTMTLTAAAVPCRSSSELHEGSPCAWLRPGDGWKQACAGTQLKTGYYLSEACSARPGEHPLVVCSSVCDPRPLKKHVDEGSLDAADLLFKKLARIPSINDMFLSVLLLLSIQHVVETLDGFDMISKSMKIKERWVSNGMTLYCN